MVSDNKATISFLMEATLLNCQFWQELLVLMSLTFVVCIRLLESLLMTLAFSHSVLSIEYYIY